MDFQTTAIVAAVAALLTVACGWLGARPPNLNRGPRLVPYRLLMVLGATFVILMLVHLVTLAGVTTGR